MSTQPEALRLADLIEGSVSDLHREAAAAELRRLSAEHEEDQRVISVWRGRTQRAEAQRDALLEVLKDVMDRLVDRHETDEAAVAARAAIKNAEGGQ